MLCSAALLLVWAAVSESGTSKVPKGPDKRVIGGRYAYQAQHPYQVALHDGYQYHCGGSLIHPSWVLTAAHCVSNLNHVGVLAGTNRLGGNNRYSDYQHADWKYVHPYFNRLQCTNPANALYCNQVHPFYNRQGLQNDIALLHLPRPAPINPYIKTIGLPRDGYEPFRHQGQYGTLSGWGATRNGGGPSSTFLKNGKLPIISNRECRRTNYVTANHFCVSPNPYTGDASCFGDSGGPLTHGNTQLGIASWVTRNCGYGTPQGFTNVGNYLPWINSHVYG